MLCSRKQINAANAGLVKQLVDEKAKGPNGNMASLNLDVVKGMNGKKQVLIRETYLRR
ncbi:hypothetical protein BDV39DRAFT_184839 [Aspergillus sergii]|uniref:Uncharacterized protein n=1 Tax=Aspergillus sergii TaxID=1034303 RepID=A0A5N6WQZ0_9EURO|nr:hypothetical protein BDV39DRAFT_184839 [Aspergillus sergii]